MGNFQKYKGNPETKLFYLVDRLSGGINTEFSDDNSPDVDFESIINFDMDKYGTLNKRNGFGELTAISEIFNTLDDQYLPTIKNKNTDNPNPEITNDNIVYMKLLRNDNNCFRNLSGFSGENAYRKYQELYGFQQNRFHLLLITTSTINDVPTSTAWLFKCYLPELEYSNNEPTNTQTMTITCTKTILPVVMTWNRNLMNLETIEYFDKIYFTGNNKGLVCFDRTNEIFSYSGFSVEGSAINNAYEPSGLEIRKVGFNVLGDDPMHFINYQNISTDSIQGIYICTTNNIPLQTIPLGTTFLLNILYTGTDNGFSLEMSEGENNLSFTSVVNTNLSTTGLKVYEIKFTDVPTSEVEIKITKTDATIEPYYDYYEVGQLDPEAKEVTQLNIGNFGMCEMYNRAVYYKDDTIWFSEINAFNYIPNYNYVTIPIEPTDKITKICYFKNIYVVFTEQRIYKMTNAFGTSDFSLTPINMSLGCHAGNTVVPVENMLFFASPRGLYALKSSEFKEGNENIKELDIKVKKLTSDYTKYSSELSEPAVRFNGVSKRAYATRYKDKYLLFFNTSYEQGDYAALNGLDTLVYQFDMQSFTTYRFKEKPTFLFMVDNAIETFCTVSNKSELIDEITLFDYNFALDSGRTITDRGDSGNDATIIGDAILNGGVGVSLNGSSDYVDINDFNGDISEGFNMEVEAQCETLNGSTLVELGQSVKGSSSEQFSGSISLTPMYSSNPHFSVIMNYQGVTNSSEKTSTVNISYTVTRDSVDLEVGNTIHVSLLENNTNIFYEDLNIDFGTELITTVDAGTYTFLHDNDGSYSKTWDVYGTPKYITYNKSAQSQQTGEFYMSGNTKASCRVLTYQNVTDVNNGKGSIRSVLDIKRTGSGTTTGTFSGTCYVYKDSSRSKLLQSQSFSQKRDWVGYEYRNAFDITFNNIPYNADGTSSVYVYVYMTQTETSLSGTYTGASTQSMPTITTSQVSNIEGNYGGSTITFPTIIENSYREIALKINGVKDELIFVLNNEYEDVNIYTGEGIGLIGKHTWKVEITKETNNYICTIKKDGINLVSSEIATNKVINSRRDNSYIGFGRTAITYFDGNIYKLSVTNNSSTLLSYIFSEGYGTSVADKSGNNYYATLVGCSWLIESGLRFDGNTGYVKLPNFSADNIFSNGFKIEFTAKFDDITRLCRIIDLSTEYGNDTKKNKNCSINVGANGNLLALNSTSLDYKYYRITESVIDLTQSHVYKIQCVDNGTGYTLSITVDNVLVSSSIFNYGGISNILRNSNFIGKSNTSTESLFKGLITQFKFTIFASLNPVNVYRNALYEFDTTPTDFGKDMYIELKSKGINMQFPLHIKKLKSLFIKSIGGYSYGEFFFKLFCDGYLTNDPKVYKCYIDTDGSVVYTYDNIKELDIDERVSLLGNARLDYTRLGEGKYQTKKIVISKAKAKNFTIMIYGDTPDYLSIENFGFTCKLGKVKER